MKSDNLLIYHCVTCGHIVHAEFEAKPPQCCGSTMAKAAAAIRAENMAIDQCCGPETMPLAIKNQARAL